MYWIHKIVKLALSFCTFLFVIACIPVHDWRMVDFVHILIFYFGIFNDNEFQDAVMDKSAPIFIISRHCSMFGTPRILSLRLVYACIYPPLITILFSFGTQNMNRDDAIRSMYFLFAFGLQQDFCISFIIVDYVIPFLMINKYKSK